jgi:AcrR family transcriptional regulator
LPRAGLSNRLVVDEAAKLIDEVGYDRLTLAALAQRLGVALPSLYKHIKGLDALLQQLSALATAELATALSDAAAGRSRLDALRAVSKAYRKYALQHPGRYPATQRPPDPTDPDHVRAAERAVGAVFAVLEGYGLRGEDAVDATRTIRSALHGFVSLEQREGFGLPREVERSFEWLVDSFHRAFSWR